MRNELPCCTEEHRVSGERLVSRVKDLIHQGSVRRVIVRDEDGHTIMEIPLTMGVVGAILLPSLVALGAIAALASDYTVVVERLEEAESAAAAAQ
jgi:hypothetical protein